MKLAERSFSSQIAREPSLEKPSFRPTRGRAPPPQFLPLPLVLALLGGFRAPPRFVPMASPYPPPRVFVFDDRRGASEGDELDKLLGIFPASTSRDAAAADVGLVQGVAGFMAPFQDAVDSPDAAGDDEPPPGGRRGGIGGSQPPPPPRRSRTRRSARAIEGSRAACASRTSGRARATPARRAPLRGSRRRPHPSSSACTRTSSSRTAPSPLCSRTPRRRRARRAAPLVATRRQAPSRAAGMGRGARRPAFGSPRAQPRDPRVRRPASLAGVSEARGGDGSARLRASPGARDRGRPRGGPRRRRVAEVSEAYDRDADADEGSRARPPRALTRGAAVLADDRVAGDDRLSRGAREGASFGTLDFSSRIERAPPPSLRVVSTKRRRRSTRDEAPRDGAAVGGGGASRRGRTRGHARVRGGGAGGGGRRRREARRVGPRRETRGRRR